MSQLSRPVSMVTGPCSLSQASQVGPIINKYWISTSPHQSPGDLLTLQTTVWSLTFWNFRPDFNCIFGFWQSCTLATTSFIYQSAITQLDLILIESKGSTCHYRGLQCCCPWWAWLWSQPGWWSLASPGQCSGASTGPSPPAGKRSA